MACVFPSVPPLCIVPQPFNTKDTREAPYALDNVREEGTRSWGTHGGRWRPSRALEMRRSRGLRRDLLGVEKVSMKSFREAETLNRNVYRIFECLASAAAGDT